uniref:XdhC and CoxI family protein n=2 Tax=Candidatus Kentrum sp. TUN TaxID=2126343 RepID=A0A451B0H3_9GAMM|nr:MAG: XdhC and CoxI family protein [Candidatus Kentron sp. TUN]
MKDQNTWQLTNDCLRKDIPMALLIVAQSYGSTPGRAGFKMAVAGDGRLVGTIGGGIVEQAFVRQARERLKKALPVLAYPVNSIRRCALLPQGAIFISPGLRRSRYPGYRMRGNPTPTGLRHSQTYCSSHSKPCFRRRVLYSSWKLRSL